MWIITEALLLSLITGGLGGTFFGKLVPQYSLGDLGNALAGVAGGGALGQVFFTLFPILDKPLSSSTTLSLTGAVTHIVVGLAGGALLTLIIGKLKNKKTTA
jgi:uncharacterized membrane protein YeaQ/YmgE (transglycosylase-associated protein family)